MLTNLRSEWKLINKLTAGIAIILCTAIIAFSPVIEALSTAPAYNADFPDPYVMVDNGTYWAYSTGKFGFDLQVISSTDQLNWTGPSNPLPVLGSWASYGLTWAPSVIKIGSNYVMYYTATSTKLRVQCIGVATSTTPAGPFTDSNANPFICQKSLGGSIDPQVFVAPNGTPYLNWKSDNNSLNRATSLYAQQLAANGLGLVGNVKKILTQSATWQGQVIEGPAMTYDNGVYYLFYGANDWGSASSGIGYATCSGPLGPCTNRSTSAAWWGSRPGAEGPASPAIFTDLNGNKRLAYHAWNGTIGYPDGMRTLWIDTLVFANGVPALQ